MSQNLSYVPLYRIRAKEAAMLRRSINSYRQLAACRHVLCTLSALNHLESALFWLRLKRHSQSSPGPGQTKAPGQKMGTDKLEALRNAFTEVASEPPLPATFFVEETRPLTLSGQPDAVAQVETTLVNFRTDADGAAAPHDSTG